MDFTIAYNTEPLDHNRFLECYVTFATANGEHHITWYVANLKELADCVAHWEHEAPLAGWTIKSIEQIPPRSINPSAQSALERMGYIKKIGEPGL